MVEIKDLNRGDVSSDGSVIILDRYVNIDEVWEDSVEQMYRMESVEIYGFRIVPSIYEGIKIGNGNNLMFGSKEVLDYGWWCGILPNLSGKLPKWFVVRKFDGEHWRFVTGFDLLDNGMVWCGGINEIGGSNDGTPKVTLPTIYDAITHIDNVLGDCKWEFFMEEQQRIFY